MPKVATTTCRVAGFRSVLHKGTVYEDNDPIVKARPELFEDPADHARKTSTPKDTEELGSRSMSSRKKRKEDDVEEATAAPGEKRNVRRKTSKDEGDGK